MPKTISDVEPDEEDEIGIVADHMRTIMNLPTGHVSNSAFYFLADGFKLLSVVLYPAFLQLACLLFPTLRSNTDRQ